MPDVYVCGTGLGTGPGVPMPLPNDPSSAASLTAIASFGGIDVHWTYPSTNPNAVAHTLLYRGITANFAASIQRGVVSGNSFYDRIAEAGTFYYWIRVVSINGTMGDLLGPASATIRSLSDSVVDTLTGRISTGILATSLRATLDNISMINANLNAEIFDREGGETSFAQALTAVSNGVAQAHSFITTEINSRVTQNAAIAEQINLVAVTLGNQVAAVVVSADAWIGPHTSLSGKVSNIGALWTAKVTVNGLIGGFGVFNDGQTVEAGFDVDTFWIGRSGTDKVLPFIIDGGTVYINKARIRNADIDSLKIAGNAVTVMTGATVANYTTVSITMSVTTNDLPPGSSTVPCMVTGSADISGADTAYYFDVGLNQSNLYIGGNLLASQPPHGGIHTLTGVIALPVGTHVITAFNHGDPNNYNGLTRLMTITAVLGKR